MEDLVMLVENLKESFSINDKKFNRSFSIFLVNNNWFGEKREVIDGKLMVNEDFYKRNKNAIDTFFLYYGKSSKEKRDYLRERFKKDYPLTLDYLDKFMKLNPLNEQKELLMLDFLLSFTIDEFTNLSDLEVEDMLEAAYDNLEKKLNDYLCSFLSYVKEHQTTAYKKEYQTCKRASKDTSAYSKEEYIKLIYHLFNKEYIEQKEMYKKASMSKNYTDTWLFLCLMLLSPIRGTDIKRIPHPIISDEPQKLIDKVKLNQFTEDEAKKVLKSVVTSFDILRLVPNKTSKSKNVSELKFFVPTSVESHIGTLFALSEAHYRLENSDRPNLIRVITTYKEIKNYMGDEIGELFYKSDFKIVSINKTVLQGIELFSDKSEGKCPTKGYMLASLARSHKGSYGEFSNTTSVYLRNSAMGELTTEQIEFELFERGTLSFVLSSLVSLLPNYDFPEKTIPEQTSIMKSLNLSPFEAESVVSVFENSQQQAIEISKKIINDYSKENINKALHRISNDFAKSKDDNHYCILSALNKPCSTEGPCFCCQYEVGTKATLFNLVNEYKRMKHEYINSSNPVIKNKNEYLITKTLLPALEELLVCFKEKFGEDALISLQSILEEAQ